MKEIKKNNRGGKRINSGRKPRFKEPTKTVAFRVPESKTNEIKKIIKEKLEEWESN